MNNVEKYYKNGFIKVNVNYKPIENGTIICIDKGLWYKFKIDEINKLSDNTYDVVSNTLVSVDGKRL